LRAFLAKHQKALVSAVSGFIVGISVPIVKDWIDNRERRAVEELIHEEARLSLQEPRRVGKYAPLFTDTAHIADARGGATFTGPTQINKRFLDLPHFEALRKPLTDRPKFITDGFSAVAETESLTKFDGVTHLGHEMWWFRRIGGQWKIEGFRYNVR
jgi:hypothetical protein